MIVSDTVVSAMASYLEEIWLFYYWFTLPVATQRENRKQLSCLFSCLCLSNISLFIALLVLNTLMQLNVSFLLLVHFFMCVMSFYSLCLNYSITIFSESPIIRPSSLSLPHAFTQNVFIFTAPSAISIF